MALDKHFDAPAVEAKWNERWAASGQFSAKASAPAEPFTILMPPPNVTGSLHMGHALTMSLQDILIRYHRMRGADALWLPGTDHAGIATQMVVERQLAAQKITRQELGREEFLKRVWAWKEESGNTIKGQLRQLGTSPDWAREYFTMDDGLSKAVRRVFVQLFQEGLIYKDKRLVNWDPKLLTAISDLEVQMREVRGKLYHFRYPYADGDGYVVVATTRPETILADGAVAVHPEDERYQALVGRLISLPIAGRDIPLIADAYVDKEFGSGCMKITAAHDTNDFEMARRHPQTNIPLINLFTPDARMNENAPPAYQGLDRFVAREKIVAEFEALGLLEKIEEITHSVPHGDRSGVVLEPYLTDQWYCNVKPLAEKATSAVQSGRTRFVPAHWSRVFFEWMENIQPWCISRQLWWGHQIPAWYGPDRTFFVAETEAEALAQAAKHYGKPTGLSQDPDVLDTWFSSGLLPFTTLGWPESTEDFKKYYPGDVLVTGFDIIFFWVARMMMLGLYCTGEVPFRTVYIHALVRDAQGQKMSKTKGNVLDPLALTQQYGADAVRFALAALAAPGRDIKLSSSRIESARNFVTKLWNATRYAEMQGCVYQADFQPASIQHTLNRWIVSELGLLQARLHSLFDEYKFNEIAQELYRFAWNLFCDWYLEFSKPLLASEDEALKAEVKATTAMVLERFLRLAAPVMPVVAAELRSHITGDAAETMLRLPWPTESSGLHDSAALTEVRWLIDLISAVRSIRSELNVPAGAQIPMQVKDANAETQRRLTLYLPVIQRLARIKNIEQAQMAGKGCAQTPLGEALLILPLAEVIDLATEAARLGREAEKLRTEIDKIDTKLANADFIARAPEEIVEEQKERREEAEATLNRLLDAQACLSA